MGKRILIINNVYDPEPFVSAQIGKALAETLAAKNIPVSVVAPYPSRPVGFKFDDRFINRNKIHYSIESENLDVFRLPSFTSPGPNPLGRLFESISFGWNCYWFIKKNAQDISKVYMNTWPLFGQYGVAKACMEKGIPYIAHIQDIYPESLVNKLTKWAGKLIQWLLMPLELYYLKHAHKIFVISDNMKSHIIQTRKINADKLIVIYNWQDEEQFDRFKDVQNTDEKFTFIYLGNIGPVAGVDTLIRAFHQAGLTNSRLIIAGNGSRKTACINQAQHTPELDIQFVDVPPGQVARIQSNANVLLLPVIKGGALSSIPSKLPAYMLSAKPILATLDKESDSARAIADADCGWVGNAEDIEWLAQYMYKVSNMDISELNSIGKNGREYCLNSFSRKVNLDKLIHCITND